VAGALAVVLAAALLPISCTQAPPQPKGKVLVIALDGATWSLIDPLIAQGKLPNLARLKAAGASGPLKSFEPTLSPVVFTTISTGRKPEEHGILRFVRKDNQGREVSFTNSDRKVRAIWNILTDLGASSTIVGWFTSWPADIVKGTFISDRNEGPLAGGQTPDSVQQLLERTSRDWTVERSAAESERFLGPAFDESRFPETDQRSWKQIEESVQHYFRVDTLRRRWTTELMKAGQTDLTAVFLKGTDPVSHVAWVYMDPKPLKGVFDPPPEAIARLGPIIPRYYEWVDEAIGELVATADPSTDIVILSDHGFAASRAALAYHLNDLLARFGWLVADASGRPDPARSLVIDPTPQGKNGRKDRRLVVNKEMLAEQAADPAAQRALVEDIAAKLLALRGNDGRALFEKVLVAGDKPAAGDAQKDEGSADAGHEGAEAAKPGAAAGAGHAGRLAIDVVISDEFQNQVDAGGRADIQGTYTVEGKGTFPLTDLATFRRDHTGMHEIDGVLLLAGPHARPGARIEGASVNDIAPTLLRLFGLPVSQEMSGKPLDAALLTDKLPAPGRPIKTWERETPVPRLEAPVQPEVEEELQDRLRTLGYIQ
jgi:predicted AlkP superfamily phosphohydrolase/phosphomutase